MGTRVVRVAVNGYLTSRVRNEAIVIPETIGAIRALTRLETDGGRRAGGPDGPPGSGQGVAGARNARRDRDAGNRTGER